MNLPERKGWVWFFAFWLLFAYGLYIGCTGRYLGVDDSWYLQAVNRLAAGERLYQDIYFGITPLSIYLTVVMVHLFGVEMVVLRAVMALCFSALCLLTYQVGRQLKFNRWGRLVIVLALMAYLPIEVQFGTPYTILAYVFLMGAWSLYLHWRSAHLEAVQAGRKIVWILALAGMTAGLSFCSKQSVGFYSLAALLGGVGMASLERKERIRELFTKGFVVGAGFAVTVVLIHLPVLLEGSLSRYLEFAYLNKTIYLQVGKRSYLESVLTFFQIATSPQTLTEMQLAYWGAEILLPFASFGLLIGGLFRGERQQKLLSLSVLIFNFASMFGAYPSASYSQLATTVPALLIGIGAGLQQFPLRFPKWLLQGSRVVVTVWCLIGVCALLLNPIRWLVSGKAVFSAEPHFRYLLFSEAFLREFRSDTQELIEWVQDKPTYLLVQNAGAYYLSTGIRNPTPYDIPLLPAFGLHGEEEIIAAIQKGDIEMVCVQKYGLHKRKPVELEAFILRNMKLLVRVGKLCWLFARR